MVNVPEDVVRPLMLDFTKEFGQQVEIVYTGNDPLPLHATAKRIWSSRITAMKGVAPFVTGGFGRWPHPVFAIRLRSLGRRPILRMFGVLERCRGGDAAYSGNAFTVCRQ
jgi:hypothetical protein